MTELEAICNDVIVSITRYLDQPGLAAFGQTSRHFRNIVRPLLHKKIKISYQNFQQLYSLCVQLSILSGVRNNVRILDISRTGLDLRNSFIILDRYKKRTESWIDTLLVPELTIYHNSPSEDEVARTKWGSALSAPNPLDALLAYIAATSTNLESLRLNLYGTRKKFSVMELLDHKMKVDRMCERKSFPDLRRLEIDHAPEIPSQVFKSLKLHHLRISHVGESMSIEDGMFDKPTLSNLHTLDLSYMDDATEKAVELLNRYEFSSLDKLRILDKQLRVEGGYHQIPDVIRDKYPKLHTLITDMVYDEDNQAVVQQPDPKDLPKVTSFRTHMRFLANTNHQVSIDWLEQLLPVNLRHAEISGMTIDSMEDTTKRHNEGVDLEIRLPVNLKSMRLIFDFYVRGHVSLEGSLHAVEPALCALKSKLNAKGILLGIYVRRVGDMDDSDDEYYIGDRTERV